MNNMMRVSVVMAGRNSKPDLLKEAINSILNQTYQDFEFVFVDDGSDRPMEPIVRSISSDERIAVYRIEPSGLGAALNYGIQHSHGEFVARIDDDDISLPTRLEKQVKYLEEHPEVSCVGAQMMYKFGNKVYPHSKFPIDHDDIIKMFFTLHFPMAHTVVMYRRDYFDKIGGYRVLGGGQDLDLFLQLGRVGKLHNIDEYLTLYTLSPSGLSVVNPKKKEAYAFALESALKFEEYDSYHGDIIKALNELKMGQTKSLIKKIGPSRKRLLIWMVQLFGKKYSL